MRKLELARAMAAEPKLLIADEAMAGLSHSEVDDILKLLMELNERGITIIMIEHIMSAVMSFSQRLVVLVSGKKIADGEPQEVVRDPQVEKAYLGPTASPSAACMPATARSACIEDVSMDVRDRRDRRAARHQRQRQVDADQVHHGHGAAERRHDHRRDRRREARPRRPHHRGDRRPRHRAGAGRPPPVSRARPWRRTCCSARSAPRRAPRSTRNLDFCYEMFSAR